MGPIAPNARRQVTDLLRARLMAGEFDAGERLREQPLAAEMGVSRGPIRDAILELTKEGYLIARPNCGVRVAPELSESTRRLLVSFRRDIESHCLLEHFDEITTLHREAWLSHVNKFKTLCTSGVLADLVCEDLAFHRSIVELSGTENLVSIWLPAIAPIRLPYSRHQSLLESHQEHAAIVEAIVKGKPKLAAKALVANIQ